MRVGTTSDDLGALYVSHGHIVLRRARRLLGNDDDARDVLQQVFASLVGEPPRFRGSSSFATYLYRATTNACLQLLRNRQTRAGLLGTQVAPAHADSATPSAEDHVTVRQLVERLSDDLVRVAIYNVVDGMTHEEIAEQLGCSRRHVGNLLDAAMAAFRKEAG